MDKILASLTGNETDQELEVLAEKILAGMQDYKEDLLGKDKKEIADMLLEQAAGTDMWDLVEILLRKVGLMSPAL